MDRYRYFIFNQKSVVVLGILQVACAGLCVVCGFMDAVFRKSTTLSETRAPLWAGLVRKLKTYNLFILKIFTWLPQLTNNAPFQFASRPILLANWDRVKVT